VYSSQTSLNVFLPAYYDDPVVADREYHNLQPCIVKLFRWIDYPFLPADSRTFCVSLYSFKKKKP